MMEKESIEVVNRIDESIKKDCSRLDFWFYGKENEDFVYFEDYFFGLRNQILLKNLLGDTEIQVSKSCLWLDKFYAPRSRGSIQNLIANVTRIKQIQEGFLSIHSSCVTKNNQALLFPAYPNVGKTLSALQLLKEGFMYLSDDTTLVDRDGMAYLTSFPSAIGYKDFLRFIKPNEIGKLKYYRTMLKAKMYESNKILGRILNPPLISLGEIFPTKGKVKVNKVITIEIGREKAKEIDRWEMEDKIMNINSYSLSRINNPLILTYSYFSDNFSVDNIERQERSNLRSFLDNCDEYYSLSCDDWNWIKLFRECKIVE